MADAHEISQVAGAILGESGDVADKTAGENRAGSEQIETWEPGDLHVCLKEISNASPPPDSIASEQLLQQVVRRIYQFAKAGRLDDDVELQHLVGEIYQQLPPGCRPRWYLLATLGAAGADEQLREFSELYADDPPL